MDPEGPKFQSPQQYKLVNDNKMLSYLYRNKCLTHTQNTDDCTRKFIKYFFQTPLIG